MIGRRKIGGFMANIETLKIGTNDEGAKKPKGFKAMASGADDGFSTAMLDAIGAFGPAAGSASQIYGTPNSSAVIGAAFSGVGASSSQLGAGGVSYSGSTPYMAAGYSGGFGGGYKAGTLGGLNDPALPGVEGAPSQMELIQTMNQNNLGLLELQAVMQNNMQGWNTKSNILSADHRARMAMIEKFSARG